MFQRKKLLLNENIFDSEEAYEKLFMYLSDINKYAYLKKELDIPVSLINNKIHTIELSNWLSYLKNNI